MKYRKKPIIVDAMQYDGSNGGNIARWIGELGSDGGLPFSDEGDRLIINTLEGDMHTMVGDWIIREGENKYYACKPDIFEATYEPVEGE